MADHPVRKGLSKLTLQSILVLSAMAAAPPLYAAGMPGYAPISGPTGGQPSFGSSGPSTASGKAGGAGAAGGEKGGGGGESPECPEGPVQKCPPAPGIPGVTICTEEASKVCSAFLALAACMSKQSCCDLKCEAEEKKGGRSKACCEGSCKTDGCCGEKQEMANAMHAQAQCTLDHAPKPTTSEQAKIYEEILKALKEAEMKAAADAMKCESEFHMKFGACMETIHDN